MRPSAPPRSDTGSRPACRVPRRDAEALAAHVLSTTRRGGLVLARLRRVGSRQPVRLPGGAPLPNASRCSTSPAWRPSVTWNSPSGRGSSSPAPRRRGSSISFSDRAGAGTVVPPTFAPGSGAIALAVATERPGTDGPRRRVRRPTPCRGCVSNAGGIRCSCTRVRRGDGMLRASSTPSVDVVISNPPYLPTGLVARTGGGRRTIPRIALWGGPAGLATVVRIVVADGCATAPGRWPAGASNTTSVISPDGTRPACNTKDFEQVTRPSGTWPVGIVTSRASGWRGEHRRRRRRGPGGRVRTAVSSCCPPTPCTASVPTPSVPTAVNALLAAKGRGRDMPVPVLVLILDD